MSIFAWSAASFASPRCSSHTEQAQAKTVRNKKPAPRVNPSDIQSGNPRRRPPKVIKTPHPHPAFHLPPQPFPTMASEMVEGQSDDIHQTATPAPSSQLSDYVFPTERLKRKMDDSEKTPVLLVACGSFSPITYLHLRMFEMAADHIKASSDNELVGGYLSPVGDAYVKPGLASADHR